MPSSQSYRVSTPILLFFLLANLVGVYISIMMLRNRMKNAWPW